MCKITTILFDLDGTIANTNEVILCTFIDTLEHVTGRTWQRNQLLKYWGMRLRDQLVTLCPAIDIDHAISYYRQRYNGYQDEFLAEFPGVREVLSELQAQGFRMGVVTSKKRENAWLTLQALGYEQFFEIVVAEEDTLQHKPDPDPLLYAAERLCIHPYETAYVGDNPDDIRAAKAAGMSAIGVGWCLRPQEELMSLCPDTIVTHANDLAVWLSQRNALVPLMTS